MSRPDYIPENYGRIAVVRSLAEMFNAPFGPENCILHPRSLSGDFNKLAQILEAEDFGFKEGMAQITAAQLKAVYCGDTGAAAAKRRIIADLEAVEKNREALEFTKIALRVVKSTGYGIQHEVYGFHADSDRYGRIICCYTAPVTEAVRNEDSVLEQETSFALLPGAKIFTFRPGDIWKQAGLGPSLQWWNEKKETGVLPFIHRAPAVKPGAPPRLMLVAN